jgi:hypothetical protein
MRLRLFTLLACAVSAFAADVKTVDTQWITDLGGSVVRSPQGRVTGVSLRGTWVEDSDLRRLSELPDLTSLDLSLTHITDQGMQELKNLRGIQDLSLYYAEYVTTRASPRSRAGRILSGSTFTARAPATRRSSTFPASFRLNP